MSSFNTTSGYHLTLEKLTKRQAAIIGLYTGVTCGSFSDIHALAEELVGHPVFLHQFGDELFVNCMKKIVKPLFLEICAQ
jgi:hypothetical protein